MPGGVADMTQVLPGAFGPHDLEELGSQTDAGPRDAHGATPASSTTKEGTDGTL